MMNEYEILKSIPSERIQEAIDFSFPYFKELMPYGPFNAYLKSVTNWDKSFYILDGNNIILGVYMLGDKQISSIIPAPEYKGLIGVEGVLLAVDDSIRGFGFGNRLKDLPSTLGVDYVWGQQFKGLDNLDDWLKRRELVGMTEFVYVTAEKF